MQVQLTAVLKDQNGDLVQGETIDFLYMLSGGGGFTSAGSAVTDQTGSAIQVVDLAIGVYDLEATFNGDSLFSASNVEISYDVVSQAQTQLTESITPASPTLGTTAITASGTLTANGLPLQSEQVTVTLNSRALAQVETDSTGSFSYSLTSLTPGKYTLAVSFAGTSAYPAASQTLTFTIPGQGAGGPGIVVAVALVAAVAVIGGALMVSRRRKL